MNHITIAGRLEDDPVRKEANGSVVCSFRLASGDVLVMGGQARLAFHGIDRVIAGTSTLLPDGGRINLTLRRVTVAA